MTPQVWFRAIMRRINLTKEEKKYKHKTIITHEKDLDVESSTGKNAVTKKQQHLTENVLMKVKSKKELDHFALFWACWTFQLRSLSSAP